MSFVMRASYDVVSVLQMLVFVIVDVEGIDACRPIVLSLYNSSALLLESEGRTCFDVDSVLPCTLVQSFCLNC